MEERDEIRVPVDVFYFVSGIPVASVDESVADNRAGSAVRVVQRQIPNVCGPTRAVHRAQVSMATPVFE